jgi:CRISPR-associated endonuclease/helicase Cas3
MVIDRLFAKSPKKGEPWRPPMLLPVHLADVHAAAGQVLDATGDDQLRALGLPAASYRDRFKRVVLLAAALHDLGKANDHFQQMIRGKPVKQGLRHEWATLLILWDTPAGEWLRSAVNDSEPDWQIVQWAIAGHHPAYDRPSPPRLAVDGAGSTVKLLVHHPDFGECLQRLQGWFRLSNPLRMNGEISVPLVGPENVFARRIAGWHREARAEFERASREERHFAAFVAAVKNTLIAADVAGSALPREVPDDAERTTWIPKAFDSKPRPGDYDAIVRHRLQGKKPYLFQREVAASTAPVTFVKAGTGTGKTAGAYLWAAEQHAAKRLYFCYPTTGTATEGYKEYLHAPEGEPSEGDSDRIREIKARLFHSRADIDFDIILRTGQDEDRPDADAATRIESLEAWSTPVVSCTVDTVLGLVQNNKRGRFAWPALAQSAFVFDEIHAYDDRLFGALLRFLQAVPGVPVLLMTASLPKAREEALRRLMERSGRKMPVIGGPDDLETRPRYRKLDGDPFEEARKEVNRGGKVLWISNTVGRVMEVADRLADVKPAPLIYHSRFKYEHRVKQHQVVVEAFKPEKNPGPALACCSQVAEMSLDLHGCTLLITDLAPVPALIQRLGRLNRDAREGAPTRPFLVITEATKSFPLDTHLPYTPADLESACGWLGKLPEDSISQRTLADAWEEFDTARRPDFVSSAWLDGGPSTTVLELREASPGITVLMEEDVPDVRSGRKKVAALALPMPPPPKKLDWRAGEEKGIPVAKQGTVIYDPNRGAEWQRAR